MENQTIVVLNRFGAMRRDTASTLQEQGFGHIRCADNIHDAKIAVEEARGDLLVIVEFALDEDHTTEFLMLEEVLSIRENRAMEVMVTSHSAKKTLIETLMRRGIKELVLKTFDARQFSWELKNAAGRCFASLSGSLQEA